MAIYYRTTRKAAEQLSKAICDITGYVPTLFKDGKSFRVQENFYGQTQMDLKLFAKKVLRLDQLCEDAKAEVFQTITNSLVFVDEDGQTPDLVSCTKCNAGMVDDEQCDTCGGSGLVSDGEPGSERFDRENELW